MRGDASPRLRTSIGRYLELKGNGARRDGTKYHDDAEQTCRRGWGNSWVFLRAFVTTHEFYGSSML